MKNIIFKNGTEDINSTEEHVFSGLGRVRISSGDGGLVVVCYLNPVGLWRAVMSQAEPDGVMPEWRTTYAITDDGVMSEFIVHAPDAAVTIIDSDSDSVN